MPTIRQIVTSRITRMYPLYSGCGKIANSRVVQFLNGMSHEQVWCRVPGGEILAQLDDFVGRAAYYAGDLDRKITWVCKKLVVSGDTVLDIGANIGLVTVLLSKLVGKTGKVHSFEPNPSICAGLKKTIDRNKRENTALHPVALGSERGMLKLFVPEGNAGAGSLLRNREGENNSVYEVPVVTLDEVIAQEGIGSIRLIKIDVEGFETSVFQGAHNLLSRIRPEAIIFELNERIESSFYREPLIRLLSSYQYDFLAIPQRLFSMSLKRVTRDPLEHDFVAVPRGEAFERIARSLHAVV